METPFESESKVAQIAMDAVLCGLSEKSTKTMVKTMFTNECYFIDAKFVKENLDEILETIENIFFALKKKSGKK